RTVPRVPEWEQIMQAMRTMAERVVRGEQSEADATAQLDAEVDAMLAKRRWLLAHPART
ncbi:MAG: ABC transporter substrate-binding protein, partial [Proteobacteria bacterium]|nr:ABC transporter substrate-binding protein [Pseudomonadota bacterium]